MNYLKAKKIINFHANGPIKKIKNPTPEESGLLPNLRPYQGVLVDNHFHELMEAIFVIAKHDNDLKVIDKNIVECLWWICSQARLLGVYEKGPLRRNKIITKKDSKKLQDWVHTIETTILMYLRVGLTDELIYSYIYYLAEYEAGKNIAFFTDYVVNYFIVEVKYNFAPEASIKVLGKLNKKAKSAIPFIKIALKKEYEGYDSNKSDFRILCLKALSAINGGAN